MSELVFGHLYISTGEGSSQVAGTCGKSTCVVKRFRESITWLVYLGTSDRQGLALFNKAADTRFDKAITALFFAGPIQRKVLWIIDPRPEMWIARTITASLFLLAKRLHRDSDIGYRLHRAIQLFQQSPHTHRNPQHDGRSPDKALRTSSAHHFPDHGRSPRRRLQALLQPRLYGRGA